MFKRISGILLGVIFLFSITQTVFALSDSDLKADKYRAQVGEIVNIYGIGTAGELVSLKGTDPDGDIVYYGAIRADNKGEFSTPIKIPDMEPGTLTITAGNGSNVSSLQIEIFIQYYATVTFDKNGGDIDASPIRITVAEGEIIRSMPSDPSKTGYAFSGWYQEKECQNAWISSIPLTGNITVYAKWLINKIPAESTTATESTIAAESTTAAESIVATESTTTIGGTNATGSANAAGSTNAAGSASDIKPVITSRTTIVETQVITPGVTYETNEDGTAVINSSAIASAASGDSLETTSGATTVSASSSTGEETSANSSLTKGASNLPFPTGIVVWSLICLLFLLFVIIVIWSLNKRKKK